MIESIYCEKFCTEAAKKLTFVKKELNRSPKGKLKVSHFTSNGKKYVRFYASVPYKGKKKREWIKNDSTRLTEFAEKAYWEEMARRMEKNFTLLKACAEGLEADDYESVLGALDPDVAKHVNADRVVNYEAILRGEYFTNRGKATQQEDATKYDDAENRSVYGDELVDKIAERVQKWREDTKKGNYVHLVEHAENLRHKATNGMIVRSKSEAAIIEILIRFGQIIRYEWEIVVGDVKLHPDFTIMKDNGQLVFWEHFGRMKDAQYVENMHRKLSMYEAVGIVPWKNLIITYDSEDGDIDLAIVESEIRNKLLK